MHTPRSLKSRQRGGKEWEDFSTWDVSDVQTTKCVLEDSENNQPRPITCLIDPPAGRVLINVKVIRFVSKYCF